MLISKFVKFELKDAGNVANIQRYLLRNQRQTINENMLITFRNLKSLMSIQLLVAQNKVVGNSRMNIEFLVSVFPWSVGFQSAVAGQPGVNEKR